MMVEDPADVIFRRLLDSPPARDALVVASEGDVVRLTLVTDHEDIQTLMSPRAVAGFVDDLAMQAKQEGKRDDVDAVLSKLADVTSETLPP